MPVDMSCYCFLSLLSFRRRPLWRSHRRNRFWHWQKHLRKAAMVATKIAWLSPKILQCSATCAKLGSMRWNGQSSGTGEIWEALCPAAAFAMHATERRWLLDLGLVPMKLSVQFQERWDCGRAVPKWNVPSCWNTMETLAIALRCATSRLQSNQITSVWGIYWAKKRSRGLNSSPFGDPVLLTEAPRARNSVLCQPLACQPMHASHLLRLMFFVACSRL